MAHNDVSKQYFHNKVKLVAERIKEYIIDNDIQSGQKLPSIRNFAKQFAVNKDTVSGATDLLAYEGIVVSKPRYGLFVSNEIWNRNKRINWRKLDTESSFARVNSKLFDMVEASVFRDDEINISQYSLSDNIYIDIIKHGCELALNTASQTPVMERFHNTGLNLLKHEIALYMKSLGMDIDWRQVVICSSVYAAVTLVANLLVKRGSQVLYTTPSMFNNKISYYQFLGAFAYRLDTDEDGVSEESFLNAIAENKNSIFFTEPLYSFPSGETTSLNRKMNILNYCNNTNIPIVEAEILRPFNTKAPASYYSLTEGQNVVYIGTFSPFMPFGFPVSWIVVPMHLVKSLGNILFSQSPVGSTFEQLIMREILRDGSYYAYINQAISHVYARHEFTLGIINKHLGGLISIKSDHPMLYWVRLPVRNDKIMNTIQTINTKLQIVPGNIYGQDSDYHIIISKVHPQKEHYEEGILLLKEAIEHS